MATGALGTLFLLGWILHVGALTKSLAGSPSVKANTALCFILCAAALLLHTGKRDSRLRHLPHLLSLVVAFLAVGTLWQYLASVNLGIDEALFRDPSPTLTVYPGRMASNTALCFSFIAAFLLLFERRSRVARFTRSALLFMIGLFTSIALIGYLYGLGSLYTVPLMTPMALPTAILLLLLLGALLTARPELLLTRIFSGLNQASVLARLALPAAAIVPIALGWARILWEGRGLMEGAQSTAVVAIANMVAFTAILLAAIRVLERRDCDAKKATESLTASEANLRQRSDDLLRAMKENEKILRHSLDVICSVDAEGRFRTVSPASERLWGYTPEELIGRRYMDLVHPDDLQKTAAIAASIMSGVKTTHFQNRYLRKDGGVTVTMWSAFWSDEDQTMFSIAHDYTEQAEIRQLLIGAHARVQQANLTLMAVNRDKERLSRRTQLILNSAADAIMGIDPHKRITFANPAAVRTLGFSPSELVNANLVDSIKVDLFSEEATSLVSRSAILSRSDGSTFPADYLLSRIVPDDAGDLPIDRADEDVEGYVLTFRDVTERHVVEKFKDEFVSVVSHELRTPLTSIRGALGLLATGKLGELDQRGQRMIEIAMSNTDRLVRLITDILDIERMALGSVVLDTTQCASASLIIQARELMEPMAEKAGIRLESVSDDSLVWADADRIQQTLTNLISNAIKFSPPETTISIRAMAVDGQVLFEVIDQGRGIPTNKLEAVFERFEQVDASDSRDKGGSGLGLAICRSIVRQHGGDISVTSVLGQGSTFSFAIPSIPPPLPIGGVTVGTTAA